jgi:hypothetical protein
MSRALKSAIVLGLIPLLGGLLIYGVWRVTRWSWLETAGLITIAVGLLCVLIGAITLAWHLWQEARTEHTAFKKLWLQGFLVGGLLFSNFPAAWFCLHSALDVMTRYTVRVQNTSDVAIDRVVLTGPGVRVEMGPISPGSMTRRHLHFQGDGPLKFSAQQQGLHFEGMLEDYVTRLWAGDKTIKVSSGGVFEVTPTRL